MLFSLGRRLAVRAIALLALLINVDEAALEGCHQAGRHLFETERPIERLTHKLCCLKLFPCHFILVQLLEVLGSHFIAMFVGYFVLYFINQVP